MTPHLAAERYVQWIIDSYLLLPHTPSRARQHDRDLATELHRQGVPQSIIQAAFLLATARRIDRPHDATPLNPIRSLHYFLPVIEELLLQQPSARYLKYLRDRLTTMIESYSRNSGPKKDAFT